MKKIYLFMALCLTTFFAAQAGEKKVYTEFLKNVLTYYYDDQYFDTDVRPGIVEFYNPAITEELVALTRFKGYNTLVGKVVFDASMKDAVLPTTRLMFCGYDDEKDEALPLMSLLSIEGLDNLNTTSTVDMTAMFMYCINISELDLSGLNTKNVTNMTSMFAGCIKLKSLDLSGWNTQNVQIMGEMFMFCAALETLDLSSFNTENVIIMENMFADCEALKSITFGANFKTDKVTNMADMFSGCGVSLLDLSGFNTENVKSMGSMFEGCENLTSITFGPNFKTDKVTKMDEMFSGCGVSSLDLSGFNTENVESMGSMFEGCENLTSIKFGKKFKAKYSYRSLFEDCTALKELNLTGFDVSSVSDMNEMFYNCSALETIYCDNDWSIEAKNIVYSDDMFYGCTKLVGGKGTKYDSEYLNVTYARPDGGTGNEGYFTAITPKIYTVYDGDETLTYYYDKNYNERMSVGTVEFYDPDNILKQARWKEYCGDVETVIIDPSMKNAPLTSLKGMFYPGYDYEEGDDYHLTYAGTITGLNYLNTENVTDMSYMFYECAELTVIDLTSFSIENLENTTKMFYDCEYLTTIYCNANMSASSKLTSASNMFYGCEELKGGKDTEFDSGKIGKDYARPDGGSATPGYFTTLDMNDKAKLYVYIRDMKMLYNFAAQYVDKSEDDMSDFKHFIETFEDTYENGTDAAISGAINLASTQKDNYIGILIEEGKTALKDILQSKLMPGDNAECRQIIADAQDAVDALKWDNSKSVEENIAILDPAIQKILTDADAALAAARLAAGIEQANSQEPKANSQKLLRNGQILILRDGKMYNVMGVEVK